MNTLRIALGLVITALATVTGPAAAQSCVTTPDDLVAWWPGEGDGQDALCTHPGTLVNGTSFATGIVGQAFQLDGVNDHVLVPDATAFALPTGAITVEAWILPDTSLAGAGIISKFNQGNNERAWLLSMLDDNRLRWAIYNDVADKFRAVDTAPGLIPDGVFTHVAASFEITTQELRTYINGVLIPNTLIATDTIDSMPDTGADVRIGAYICNSLCGTFDGLIDEPAVYDRVLTDAEVAAIHAAGAAGKCTDRVHNLTQDTWYVTIGAAIAAAVNGDEIVAMPGTYCETIDFDGKAITLRGAAAGGVIIDGSGLGGTVVRCDSGEGPGTVLANVTITGGESPTLGGGMRVFGSPTVMSCTFSGNTGDFGGGMWISGSPAMTNCMFISNVASGLQGGGMYIDSGSPTLTNCTFFLNDAGDSYDGSGGGLHVQSGSPTLTNCIVAANQPYDEIAGGTPTVTYSWVSVAGGWPGEGNISSALIGFDGRPLPYSATVDAGNTLAVAADSADLDGDGDTLEPVPFDRDGLGRQVGAGVDMGAYEQAAMPNRIATGDDPLADGYLDVAPDAYGAWAASFSPPVGHIFIDPICISDGDVVNGSTDGGDWVYYVTHYQGGPMTVSLCGSTFDTWLGLYDNGNNLLASNGNFCGVQSQVTYDGAAGDVWIYFEEDYEYEPVGGDYTLTVTGGGGACLGSNDFNPPGPLPLAEPTFTSGLQLFTSTGGRELLSDNLEWRPVLGGATLGRQVTTPCVASDGDGDGVDDTLTSSFRVFGPGTELAFDLTQRVLPVEPGAAVIQQDYTITNNSGAAVILNLVRAYDGDLSWAGDFTDDEVGTTMHAAGGDTFVFQREVDLPETAVTLSSPDATGYYGGKHGVTPAGGVTAYGYGTDTQVWDASGVPESWENHIAGVGYDTDGVSGPAPPGSTDPEDAFVGLSIPVILHTAPPSQTATIRILHTYGQSTPAVIPTCPADTNGDDVVNVQDLLNVILDWGSDGTANGGDTNDDDTVNVQDLLNVILAWGVCP